MLYRSLVQRHDHPDMERLYTDIRPLVPSISLNTVYRTIRAFESAGLAVCVATWEDAARFDGNLAPHGHLLCEHCGAIANVDVDDLFKLDKVPLQALHGTISRVQLLLHGTCKQCLVLKRGPV
jgi:Fur family peroxide stress response transcriptional regulator